MQKWKKEKKHVQICPLEIQSVQAKKTSQKAVAFPPPKVHVTTDLCKAQTHLFYKREISCIHPEYDNTAYIITSTQQSQMTRIKASS